MAANPVLKFKRGQQEATKVGHFCRARKARHISDPIFRKLLGNLGDSPWIASTVGDETVTRQLPCLGPLTRRTIYVVVMDNGYLTVFTIL